MESALSRLVVLRQPGLTFAGLPCLSMSRRTPARTPRGGMAYHAEKALRAFREACKASESGGYPVGLAPVGDRVEIFWSFGVSLFLL